MGHRWTLRRRQARICDRALRLWLRRTLRAPPGGGMAEVARAAGGGRGLAAAGAAALAAVSTSAAGAEGGAGSAASPGTGAPAAGSTPLPALRGPHACAVDAPGA